MPLKRFVKHVHFLPIIVCLLFPLTFIITFFIAVSLNDVFPGLPYISETGTLPPESCVFSLFLNMCALLLGGCVYVRHLQVTEFARQFSGTELSSHEISRSLVFGTLSSFGLCIVANFQLSNIKPIHYLGACSCLWGGTIYFIYQTKFSFKMGKGVRLIYTFYIRYLLCALSVICNVAFVVAGYMSSYYYTDLYLNIFPLSFLFFVLFGTQTQLYMSAHMYVMILGDNPRKWKPSEPGWSYHVISTGAEWILATTFSILVLTFLPEFKKIHIEYLPVICWNDEFLLRLKLNKNINNKSSDTSSDIYTLQK